MYTNINYEMLHKSGLLGAEEFQTYVPKPGKDDMQKLKITVKGLKLLIDDFLDEPESEHRIYAEVSCINPHDTGFQKKYGINEPTNLELNKSTNFELNKSRTELANESSFQEILSSEKKEGKLNFFVMFDYLTMHSSLVVNYAVKENNYREINLFIDPLGTYNEKWPPDKLIGISDEEPLFQKNETLVMESCLQRDSFNCRSFCLEFIKSFTEKFKNLKGSTKEFDEYIKTFFQYKFTYKTGTEKLLSEKPENTELFVCQPIPYYGNVTLSLLPIELLKTCQSFSFLRELKSRILKYYNKQITLTTNSLSANPKGSTPTTDETNKLNKIIAKYEEIKKSVEDIYAKLEIPEDTLQNLEEKIARQEITKKREEHLERLQELLEKHKLQNEE